MLHHAAIAKQTAELWLKSIFFRVALFILCFFSLTACGNSNQAPPDLNMVISVSTDGNYAIATNTNKQAVLWNLQNHSYKVVFKNANIYSAYFIKNTDDFIYQNDKTNEVVVENVNGQIIKTFNPGFPTYGEVMTSDLQSYYGVDFNDQVFKINMRDNAKTQYLWHYCDQNDPSVPKGAPYTCGSFLGDGKLFNLNLSSDNNYLVTSGNGEFYIWNTQLNSMIAHIQHDNAQTVAAISPNNNYLISGDAGSDGYYYNLKNDSGYLFSYLTTNNDPKVQGYFEKNDPYAAQQYSYADHVVNQILAVKFIDQNKVLVIYGWYPIQFNFAALYDINKMSQTKIIGGLKRGLIEERYLDLMGSDGVQPLTKDQFSRDQAIDTSPSAHILVMSQQNANGIIVYKYDSATQTLTRDWVGTVKSSWW